MRLAIGTTRSFNLATKPIIDIIVAQIRQVLYYDCIAGMSKTHGQVVAWQIVAVYLVGGGRLDWVGGRKFTRAQHIHKHLKKFFQILTFFFS